MPLSGQTLVFLDIENTDRLKNTQTKLISAGATVSTCRTLLFAPNSIDPQKLGKLIDELENGECVTAVYEEGGQLTSLLIVPPKQDGGIAVET